MKCVHSVVLSKINACVSGRKVVCSKQIDEKLKLLCNDQRKVLFSLKVRSFKSKLTRLCATHHSYSLSRQIKPRALGVVLSTSK